MSGLPRKIVPLTHLQIIRIIDDNQVINLILMFADDVEMVLHLATSEDREKLLSCLLTLRQFAFKDGHQVTIGGGYEQIASQFAAHKAPDAHNTFDRLKVLVN